MREHRTAEEERILGVALLLTRRVPLLPGVEEAARAGQAERIAMFA